MVSRISGPIPANLCYEKQDEQSASEQVMKVPASRVHADQAAVPTHGSLYLALQLEGHSMPSAYKQTSVWSLCHCFCFVLDQTII